MAGGRKYIRPKSWIDAEAGLPCERTDDRDLINELKAREYKYFETADDFYKWDPESEKKVIALFNYEDMCYEIERNKDIKGEPGLWDMVDKGLKYLKLAPNGFFLLIEAGRIDHCAHDNFQDGLLYECIAFDKALGVALEFLESNPNTLILVATDHGAGGPNGIGFINSKGEIKSKGSPGTYPDGDSDGFPDSLNIANPVVIGWASNPANLRRTPSPEKSPGEHTAEDGIAFAAGKNSQLLSGFMDNTDLYYIIKSTMEGRSDVPVLRKRAGK
jgi:alkaline phosphatase